MVPLLNKLTLALNSLSDCLRHFLHVLRSRSIVSNC